MKNEILSLTPTRLWRHFYDLTQIPRPSKQEAKAVAHIVNFGEKLGLYTETDSAGNVLIRKPATQGLEGRKAVVLQAHVDMVPQKNSDTPHDFATDPIAAYVDGDWVRARGTTLGADNGIGVAAAMAILESADIQHPALEALFTVDEETGMTGAFALKPNWLQGDILINLDSEEEGELCVGCAGGVEGTFTGKYDEESVNAGATYELSVTGLKGGHSGMDIALGRGNANKIMARILKHLTEKCGVRLARFDGGTLRNAIPREAFATIVVEKDKEATVKNELRALSQLIEAELVLVDEQLKITLTPTGPASAPHTHTPCTPALHTPPVLPRALQLTLLNALCACPDGVVRMSNAIPGLVETSTNLAIVNIGGGQVSVQCLLRSSVDSAKEHLSECMAAVFTLAGMQSNFSGGYPGWQPNPSSPILKKMSEVYERMFGTAPHVRAVHAGLECGLLGGGYPNMDMISCGPTIRHPHSPDERVNVASVEKWWKFLLEVLRDIPKKG